VDWLDYHLYGVSVIINMGGTVSVPGLHGTFTNLEGVIGSPFNDTLIGRDGGSTFHVTGLNQGNLDGNFLFVSIEKLQGGSHTDTVDYSALPGPVSVILTGRARPTASAAHPRI